MRCSFIATLAAALLSSTSAAIQVSQHDASPAIVSLRTQRKTVEDPVERDTLRRRQTVTEALNNEVSSHSLILGLGKGDGTTCWYRPFALGVGYNPKDGLNLFSLTLVFQCFWDVYCHGSLLLTIYLSMSQLYVG